MRHIVSFVRAPLGYITNLVATLDSYIPGKRPDWYQRAMSAACESLCIRDGVQDDMLF